MEIQAVVFPLECILGIENSIEDMGRIVVDQECKYCIDQLQQQGIKVAAVSQLCATTNRYLELKLEEQGIQFDGWSDGYSPWRSKSYPLICLQLAEQMQICPVNVMLQIGQSVTDIQQGTEAGLWSVGFIHLGEDEQGQLEELLYLNGADQVARSYRQLTAIIGEINKKLANCTATIASKT